MPDTPEISQDTPLVPTNQQEKLLETAMEIYLYPAGPEDTGYLARSLIMATLPHSNSKTNQFTRINGNHTLTVTALSPGIGLPYGTYPRLILVWICTEVKRTRSPELVLGKSLVDFMDQLGLQATGGRWGTIPQLKKQMERLLKCSFFIDYREDKGTAFLTMNVAQHAALYWNPKDADEKCLFNSTLTLHPAFFAEIMAHPIPFDIRALNALKGSALALDIYPWLAYRIHRLNRHKDTTEIRWRQLANQFGSDYPDDAQGLRNFKRHYLVQMKKVAILYPDLIWEVGDVGLVLRPSPTPIHSL